ncbi:hypothetical protein [Adlercreutzia caecimuris]|uniref:hypothetical protein n=1 Tax=Adlercreutzia caecimuris TaxID=671266 RepID=UPI001372DB0C|nr:hypothetical protein [Adlercreutzia caecimuris]
MASFFLRSLVKGPKEGGCLFNLMVGAIVMVFYCLNRFLHGFDGVLPREFLLYHFGDLCGGILFPIYVNLVCIAAKSSFRIDSLGKAMMLEALCSAVWEGAIPLLWRASTADILDVVCYFVGGLVYWIMMSLCNTGMRRSVERDG